jgi:endoglucanase
MPTFGNAQLKLLERLCNAIAISGDEGEVRKIVLEEIKACADEVKVDALGNVLAIKRGTSKNRVKVMLDAHMDEVGFMLVSEDGDGIYQFETVGGIDVRHLVGKQVYVGKDRTPGVIGGKPVHLMDSNERLRKVPFADRFGSGRQGEDGRPRRFRYEVSPRWSFDHVQVH